MGRLFDDNDTRIGVAIFGSTGSIGKQTMDVISRFPERYGVEAITAYRSATTMIEQIQTHHPVVAVMEDHDAWEVVNSAIKDSPTFPKDHTYVLPAHSQNAPDSDLYEKIASDSKSPIVVAAMVGFAGLRPT